MANTLVSFLERRKKTAVKASTLLQKTEEQSEEEQQDKDAEEQEEAQSEHDNEWRVSSDESDEAIQAPSNFGPNLVKIVQTVENGEPEDSVKESQERKTQQIWPREVEQQVEEPVTKPKIWVPKFRDSKGILSSKNDVDLAESVKMFTKSDVASLKKKKKIKPKSQEQEDDFAVVKVKFDVFSLLKDEYSQFKSQKFTMDEQLIKMKYSNRYHTHLYLSLQSTCITFCLGNWYDI
uniref:Uncharacterized protein n=1 Tax=Theileria parva TaxID=5875 RepID=Q4MZV8_THEPA|eukprot:XP_763421.1 hypothetical protein [Theileria parva strain Muguga]